MRITVRSLQAGVIACAALASAGTARAQSPGPALHLAVGSFHHLTDLHTYFPVRFEDAIVLGVGVSVPVHPRVAARVAIERVATRLMGDLTYRDENLGGEPDNILSGELQFVGSTSATVRVRPFIGVGVGLRRIVVNSYILSDDIIDAPWKDAQVQPSVSALAGIAASVSDHISVSAEVKWSHSRFRAGDDSWGLPLDPVEWDNELRPTIRLEASLW